MIIGFGVALILFFAARGVAGAEVMEPDMADTYAAYLQHEAQHARADLIAAVNGPYSAPDAPYHVHTVRRSVDTGGVERWRTLVAAWFPADKVDEALSIISCESGGDPSIPNPTSSALGLWQFLKGWYTGKWSDTVGVFDPLDPVASMRAAAIVSKNGTNWGDWVASRHCHGLT